MLLQQMNVAAFVTGAVQPKLNQKNLNSIPMILADAFVHGAFSGLIDPLFEKVRIYAGEKKLLSAQRDALLPKLVSGDVGDCLVGGIA